MLQSADLLILQFETENSAMMEDLLCLPLINALTTSSDMSEEQGKFIKGRKGSNII